MNIPSLQMSFKLPFSLSDDDGMVVSHCPILDVHSQGETEDEAVTNLIEAIQIFIESCILHGSIESVLRDCGFEPSYSYEESSWRNSDLLNLVKL